MSHTLGNPNGVKMFFSVIVLTFLLYLYFSFLSDLGDIYPDMIRDEVVSGLVGLVLMLIWFRTANKRLKH